MSVYTRRGDDGYTRLLSGERVSKSSKRIRAIGGIDELSSYLGLLRSLGLRQNVKNFLVELQNDLFKIGSMLAYTKGRYSDRIPRITSLDVEKLESQIDRLEAKLDVQKFFILPGGSLEVSYIHIARTVCRRVESDIAELFAEDGIDEIILKYMNRMSDYLYVLARYVAKEQGIEEQRANLKD